MSIQLDHEEGTDQPHGDSTWFLRSCAASCDHKRMLLVSVNFLYTTGCSTSRVFVISAAAGGSHVQTEVKQPLLPVVCPLCKIEEIANQESGSSSLPHAKSVSLQFSSVSDCYDHIIWCHLSLPGITRARFAKIAQSCSANNASCGETFCGWQCAQNRETCSSTRIRREKNARVEPLQPEECHRKPEAGRCLGAHLEVR